MTKEKSGSSFGASCLRATSTWLLRFVLTVSALCVGCSGESTGPESKQKPPVISPNAVVLDSTQVVLRPDSAEQATGVYTFDIIGAPPSVTPGSIIVGAQDGGILRRVTAVQKNGSHLVLTTTIASLTDVVLSGTIDDSITLELPQAATRRTGQVVWGPAVYQALAGGITIQGGDIILNDVAFISAPHVSLKGSGRIHFAPNLVLHWVIDSGSVQSARIAAQGDLKYDTDISLSGTFTADVSSEVPLYTIFQVFYTVIGGVPVIGEAELTFKGVASAGLSGEASASSGFQSTGVVAVGAEYSKTGSAHWSNLSTASVSISPQPVVYSAPVGVHANIGAKVELRLSLYHVVGPFMSVEAHADYSRTADLVHDVIKDKCEAAVIGAVGIDFRILQSVLLGYSVSGDLWRRTFCDDSMTDSVRSVTVTPPLDSVVVGDAVQLVATLTDAAGNVLTGHPVTWASSDDAVATVSVSGLVTAVAPGMATITATAEGKSGTATVTIFPALPIDFGIYDVVDSASNTAGPCATALTWVVQGTWGVPPGTIMDSIRAQLNANELASCSVHGPCTGTASLTVLSRTQFVSYGSWTVSCSGGGSVYEQHATWFRHQ